MEIIQTASAITSSNEISLIIGLIITGIFYVQYQKYESQLEREELIDNFLRH